MFSEALFALMKALSSGKYPENLSLNLNNIRISIPSFQMSLSKILADALEKGKIPLGLSLDLCNTLSNHNAAVIIQKAILSLNFINTLRIKKIITGHWDIDIKIAQKIQYVIDELQEKIPLSLGAYGVVKYSPRPKFSFAQSSACFCAVELNEAKFRAYQSENIFAKRELMKTRFEQQKINIKKTELFLDAQRTYTAMATEFETESNALLRTFYAERKDIRFRALQQDLDRANADDTCRICMNKYGLPVNPKCVLMPCRHTVCNTCVTSLRDIPNAQSSGAGMQSNEYGDLYYSMFDCPLCKRGVVSTERI